MKQKTKNRVSQCVALILCLLMGVSMTGNLAFAAPGEDGLCEHHTEHTKECGYQEAQDAKPCNHVHDDTCGYQETEGEESCTHVHDENCGYAEAVEGSPCTYVCEECNKTDNAPKNTDEPGLSGDTKDVDGSPAPQSEDFSEGRSITYYAAESDNNLFGIVSDYLKDGKTLSEWNTKFTKGEVAYSEKKVSQDSTQSYCSFLYQTESIDWGSGAEATHSLTKTYNAAVPDSEIVAEGYETSIVMPFNGSNSGNRFKAYNTKPDGTGEWYRCGQTLPKDVTKLYAQFCTSSEILGEISNMTAEATVGINLNGNDTAYTTENPYVIPVIDGKLTENKLYYTAYLNMGEMASLMSWARMDKMNLDLEKTYVELTINFDKRLNLFADSNTFTFQYTGGFSPYQDGDLLEPDAGTLCTYTVTVDKSDMPDNTLTLKLGLNATADKFPDLTLKDYSEMSLTVSGQKGAEAIIPEELAEKAAEGKVADTDESFIKTDGNVKIQVGVYAIGTYTVTRDVEKPVTPVYAQLRKAETVTLTPQDMTAYTGGDSISGDNFPSVRYQIDTPDGVNPEDITFSVDGTTCKAEKAGDYYLLSQVANTFVSQDSTAGTGAAENDAAAGVYDIGVADEASLSATASGTLLDVDVADAGTLTVRNVSEPDKVVSGDADIAQPVVAEPGDVNTDDGIGMAVIPENTEFYTNGNEDLGLLGDDDSHEPQVALLFDDILPGEEDQDTKQLLTDRADKAGYSLTDDNSEFKYLDLINENDGNAWVSANDGSVITVYWPCPAGVDADKIEAEVLHFKGLHREYRGDIENQVENCEVEVIEAKVEGNNIVFELKGDKDAGSFSPFAVHWKETDSSLTPGGGDKPTGGESQITDDEEQTTDHTGKASDGKGQAADKSSSPKTGDTSNISLWITLLVFSCLGIIAIVVLVRKRNSSFRY